MKNVVIGVLSLFVIVFGVLLDQKSIECRRLESKLLSDENQQSTIMRLKGELRNLQLKLSEELRPRICVERSQETLLSNRGEHPVTQPSQSESRIMRFLRSGW